MQRMRTTALVLLATFCCGGSAGSLRALAEETAGEPPALGNRFVRAPWKPFSYGDCVRRFEFSPRGEEVWCIAGHSVMGPERCRAFIYSVPARQWQTLPAAGDRAALRDVAFSRDGKTTWLSLYTERHPQSHLRQRETGAKDWRPFAVSVPEFLTNADRWWSTPNGRELWLNTAGAGLTRVKLQPAGLIQYVRSKVRRVSGVRHETLVEDYAADLVFTADSQFAICAASGGGNYGITKIDLVSDRARNFPVEDAIDFERLVMSPDNKRVWCVGNNSFLWCFDIGAEAWTHRCSSDDGMPIESIRSLVCSPDSRQVWIASDFGIGCYSTETKLWTGFTAEAWQADFAIPEIQEAALALTADGRQVVAGHAQGVAVFAIDGAEHFTLKSDLTKGPTSCSQIVPIPKTNQLLCALEYESGQGALYLLSPQARTLERLVALNGAPSRPWPSPRLSEYGSPFPALCANSICRRSRSSSGMRFLTIEPHAARLVTSARPGGHRVSISDRASPPGG